MENKNRMTKQDVQDLYNMITKKLKITYTVFDPVNATDPQALGVCHIRPGGTSKNSIEYAVNCENIQRTQRKLLA